MQHKIVSRDAWLIARNALLVEEKELTRARDRLSARRRELPWVKVEKSYAFEAPEGKVSLADLFGGRSQLVVKHVMMAPGQKHQCVGCAFELDHVGPALVHLENHDVSYVAIAPAPLAEIEPYKRRMGWRFTWVSSHGSDFSSDFGVPPGFPRGPVHTVFHRNQDGEIFHTYSAFGRGAEEVMTTYMYLDLTPKGRDEPDRGNLTEWVRPHDRYGAGGSVDTTGRYNPEG